MSNQAQQNQFADLLIKGEEIKQLDAILGELPTKWGYPLINFIQAVANKRAQEAQAAQEALKSFPSNETQTAQVESVSTDNGEIKS